MGRKSTYDPKVAAAICERLSKGEPLAQIIRDEGMPGRSTVYRWLEEHEGFAGHFARARSDGFDAIAEETMAIADDARNDWMERLDKDGQGIGWQLNGDHVQRSKLRIETRLKLLAKWDPKRYGERIDVGGDLNIAHTIVTGVPEPRGKGEEE